LKRNGLENELSILEVLGSIPSTKKSRKRKRRRRRNTLKRNFHFKLNHTSTWLLPDVPSVTIN
jgi:hypothetical protein